MNHSNPVRNMNFQQINPSGIHNQIPDQGVSNQQVENHNLKKKDEINFEKLFITVLEFKQEAFKSLKVFSDFFKNYLNRNVSGNNTKEIIKFIEKIEENKNKISESKFLKIFNFQM